MLEQVLSLIGMAGVHDQHDALFNVNNAFIHQ